jgi:hypothetical protein
LVPRIRGRYTAGVYTPQDAQEVSFTSPFKPQGKNKRKFTILRDDYGTPPEKTKFKKEEEEEVIKGLKNFSEKVKS